MVEGAIKFYPQRACDDSFILQPMAIIKTLPSTPYKYQSLDVTPFLSCAVLLPKPEKAADEDNGQYDQSVNRIV